MAQAGVILAPVAVAADAPVGAREGSVSYLLIYPALTLGAFGIVMAVAMPLGMVVFGPLADVMPIEILLIAAGILTFVVIGLAVWLPAGQRAIAAAREASQVAEHDPAAGAAAVEAVMHGKDS